MRPGPRSVQRVAVAVAIALVIAPGPMGAQDGQDAASAEAEPEAAESSEAGVFTGADIDTHAGRVFDAIVLRPLGLAGLAVGAVLFVPAAALSVADRDAFDECVELFLKVPARNVFTRPLGDF